jgi:diadenosine tetraphosphate (Ap4A) HIT family hydrolase
MACPLCETLEQVRAGGHPRHVMSLEHCEVVLHDNQVCRGWCVLIAKAHAEHAAALPAEVERGIFAEAALVGRALRAAFPDTGPREGGGADGQPGPPRINYGNLGNVVAHVHWHVVPRHAEGAFADVSARDVPWNLPRVEVGAAELAELRVRVAAAIVAAVAAEVGAAEVGINDAIAMAHVASVEASIEFYGHMGFTPVNTLRGGDGRLRWAMVASGGAHLMFARASGAIDADQQAILLYLYTRDVAALRARLLSAGVQDAGDFVGAPGPGDGTRAAFAITRPEYMPGGEMRVVDPDGYVLLIGQEED